MKPNNFIAERVSRSASISLNGNIDLVFPLFGAFEERKWADGWQPQLLYPVTEKMAEGTTFQTKAHSTNHTEKFYTWTVARFEPLTHLVQYLVMTPNRFWTITVQCKEKNRLQTTADITYSYTGLNEEGNKLNKMALEKMYSENLEDWQRAVNYYLEKGETLKEN